MIRKSGKVAILGLVVAVMSASALAEQPPPCTDDPSRTVFAGVHGAPCKKFHGDQASCDLAFYMNGDGKAVSCAFIEGTCVGCGGENAVCATNTCDGSTHPVSPVTCEGDPGRSALLGKGNNGSRRCRNLDQTDQATCHNAYYDDDSDPVACFWESGTGFCRGCGGDQDICPANVCDPTLEIADATCPQDPGRTNLIGFGGNDSGPCRRLDTTDQATCEDAYYEDEGTGVGVACWWDGDECRGSGFDDFFGRNSCLSSATGPPRAPGASCPEDPSRTNLLGFGADNTRACRQLDATDQATCENSYYDDILSGAGVACWWDGDECRGSLDDHSFENACQRAVLAATAVCADPRTNLLGFGNRNIGACRALDDTNQATCENAYYEHFRSGVAVACMWNSSGECRACGGKNDQCTVNVCAPPSCAGDLTRMDYIGFGSTSQGLGQSSGSCRQFDGDEAGCDDAWYASAQKGRGVGCWWDGSECRGTTKKPDVDDCRDGDVSCSEDSGRTVFLGFGGDNSQRCRVFDDTDASTCEMAYYEHSELGHATACWWAAGDKCLGSSRNHFLNNTCRHAARPAANAICAGEPGRGMLLGYGHNHTGERGSACRSLDETDQPTCENAYYENEETGLGVACWWDDGQDDCRGTSYEFRSHNACSPASGTCTMDPTRNNLVGFGGNDSEPCRTYDGTDEPTCEAAYYVSVDGLTPVACWWDGDECRGTSTRFFFENKCLYDDQPLVPTATCDATPLRTTLLGFGSFGGGDDGAHTCRVLDNTSEVTCENAFYESIGSGNAVACWWDGGDCRGTADDNSEENVCLPNRECTLDPERTNRLGFGDNDTEICRQLDGSDQATCENAFYITPDGDPVACWWMSSEDECRGSNSTFSRLNACVRTPLPAAATCGARTNLLGFGSNDTGACRRLDSTDSSTCENAFYEDPDDYQAVACRWNAGTEFCLGTSRRESMNVCDADGEPPACPRDTNRTVFLGHGGAPGIGESGGACHTFDSDQAMCESAFYLNSRNAPVACHWDDSSCGGTNGQGSFPSRGEYNTCLTTGVTCQEPRTTVLGSGSDGSNRCHQLDFTSEATCEDAYYIGFDGQLPVACSWNSSQNRCEGCGRNRGGSSECASNVCAALECSGDLARSWVGRCGNLNSEAACEGAWHTSAGIGGLAPYAASCFWDADDGRCFGCGVSSQANKGCANACVTACGNGVVDNGETCDDGNMFDDDCCSSSCQTEANGSPCTDRLFCTEGLGTCQAGECAGATPRVCGSCLADDCDELFDRCEQGDQRRQAVVGAAQLQGGGPPRRNDMSFPLPDGTFCDDGLDGTDATCDGEGMCIGQLAAPTPAGPLPAAPAPAMGRWGYAVVMLGLLAISLTALRRRRDGN